MNNIILMQLAMSSPQLRLKAIFKVKERQFDLISNAALCKIIDGGMGGCATVMPKRHEIANKKFMPIYDTTQTSTYISYWDKDNQYCAAMCFLRRYIILTMISL